MEEIAEVYSRALFEAAKEHDSLDDVHEQLGEFADALDENRDLRMFLFSPHFSSEEKKEGISKVIEGANEQFENFLKLLAERHRMPAIHRIRREFDSMWREENKLLQVNVTSAVELDEKIVKDIGKRIEDETGQKIELSANVDPEVLGGLVLRVGNRVLDASIRSRLERIRKQVTRAA